MEKDRTYDAFITYRGGPDAAEANALYEILKANGLTPAIDSQDFSPAETFLDEMARCVRQSRYTIALISQRYATSHFTQEEAIMQQILDNREKQRRLIVAYVEDFPAPLWMQSRVGVRLFQDKGNKNQPELKRLVKLLMLRGETHSLEEEKVVVQKIEANWKKLPKKLLELGVYGLAGYGVLSMVADMNLDVAKDATADIVSDAVTDGLADHGHSAAEHITDHAHGIAEGIGKVLKHIVDTFW